MRSSHICKRRTVAAAIAAPVVALGVAATANAVEVRGTLGIPESLTEAAPSAGAKYQPYWEEWNGFLEKQPPEFAPNRELAVVLTGKTTKEEPAGCTYALRGGDLAPATVVARVGTTLRIENRDGCSHELYAEGLDGFSPLPTSPGHARTLQVSTAGDWPVRDRLYPHVNGHLHALNNLVACGRIDAKGKFTFPEVPPGTYTLRVFHQSRELAKKPVEAGEAGDVLRVGKIALSTPSD